jgi:hypothetical protein
LLAHHFSEAGLNERAVPYWLRAGQNALERVALSEAVNHLNAALTVNSRLQKSVERDGEELQIRLLLASAYLQLLGWAAVEVPRTLTPAHDLAKDLNQREKLASILYYVCLHHLMRREYEMADAANRQLYSLAKSTEDTKSLIIAQMMETCASCWKGDFVGSRRVGADLVARYQPSAHGDLVQTFNHDPSCLAQTWAGVAIWSLGYPDEAFRVARDQLALKRIPIIRKHSLHA